MLYSLHSNTCNPYDGRKPSQFNYRSLLSIAKVLLPNDMRFFNALDEDRYGRSVQWCPLVFYTGRLQTTLVSLQGKRAVVSPSQTTLVSHSGSRVCLQSALSSLLSVVPVRIADICIFMRPASTTELPLVHYLLRSPPRRVVCFARFISIRLMPGLQGCHRYEILKVDLF